MADMICSKSMARCQTPGMCSPHGGCQPEKTEWQRGYDEGRRMGSKTALAERDQLKAKTDTWCHYGDDDREHTYYGDKAAIEALTRLIFEVEVLRKRVDEHSPLNSAPLTSPDTKCLVCSEHHYGGGALPCPRMRSISNYDLPETRSGQVRDTGEHP